MVLPRPHCYNGGAPATAPAGVGGRTRLTAARRPCQPSMLPDRAVQTPV